MGVIGLQVIKTLTNHNTRAAIGRPKDKVRPYFAPKRGCKDPEGIVATAALIVLKTTIACTRNNDKIIYKKSLTFKTMYVALVPRCHR